MTRAASEGGGAGEGVPLEVDEGKEVATKELVSLPWSTRVELLSEASLLVGVVEHSVDAGVGVGSGGGWASAAGVATGRGVSDSAALRPATPSTALWRRARRRSVRRCAAEASEDEAAGVGCGCCCGCLGAAEGEQHVCRCSLRGLRVATEVEMAVGGLGDRDGCCPLTAGQITLLLTPARTAAVCSRAATWATTGATGARISPSISREVKTSLHTSLAVTDPGLPSCGQ